VPKAAERSKWSALNDMASFSRVATRHYRLVAQARCSSLPISAKRTLSTASSSSEPLSSVNESEIAFFSRLSSLWWDEAGEFAQLHKMNPIRVGFIREKLLEVAREEQGEAFAAEMENSSVPLKGMDVLDVGCGGGLLSEVRTLLAVI
jgi:polyprenyldihydroxybenzoate methyltransferase / 3-demethylubiquinol 3-O-methyltransferase